jgi:hypothetical protein
LKIWDIISLFSGKLVYAPFLGIFWVGLNFFAPSKYPIIWISRVFKISGKLIVIMYRWPHLPYICLFYFCWICAKNIVRNPLKHDSAGVFNSCFNQT